MTSIQSTADYSTQRITATLLTGCSTSATREKHWLAARAKFVFYALIPSDLHNEFQFSQNKTEILGNVKVEWGIQPNIQAVTNAVLFKRPNNGSMDLQYTLHTPYYTEDTVVARLKGDRPEDVWDIACTLFSPRSNQLAFANVSYMKLDNVNGTVRSKTPFTKLSQVGADFQVVSNE